MSSVKGAITLLAAAALGLSAGRAHAQGRGSCGSQQFGGARVSSQLFSAGGLPGGRQTSQLAALRRQQLSALLTAAQQQQLSALQTLAQQQQLNALLTAAQQQQLNALLLAAQQQQQQQVNQLRAGANGK